MPTSRLPRRAPTPPRIATVRTAKVVVDDDLARLYGVTTARLNQALKRNRTRFPGDFAFQLNASEWRILKSQFVISSGGHGGRRSRPWVFTEHGAIMAASVLNSPRAIDMSIFVVRAFVQLRELAAPHRELAAKVGELERRVTGHDDELEEILRALRRLIQPTPRPQRAIGFANQAGVTRRTPRDK